VNVSRVRIAWFVVFVVLAILNFDAIRVLTKFQNGIYRAKTIEEQRTFERMSKMCFTLEFGALPMANILLLGLMIGYWRPGSRRFVWGFEALGVTALALYIAGATVFNDELLWPYLKLVIEPMVKTHGGLLTTVEYWCLQAILAVMLVLPQMAIALIGGLFTRYFRMASGPDPIRF
jgi:hypothetical protein